MKQVLGRARLQSWPGLSKQSAPKAAAKFFETSRDSAPALAWN